MKKAYGPEFAYCKRHIIKTLESGSRNHPLAAYGSFGSDDKAQAFDESGAQQKLPLLSPQKQPPSPRSSTVPTQSLHSYSAPTLVYSDSFTSDNSILENRLVELARICNATPDLIVYLQRHYMNMRDGAASLIGTITRDVDDDVGSSVSTHSDDDGTKRGSTYTHRSAISYVILLFKFVCALITAILFVKFAVHAQLSMMGNVVDAIAETITMSSTSSVELIMRLLGDQQANAVPSTRIVQNTTGTP